MRTRFAASRLASVVGDEPVSTATPLLFKLTLTFANSGFVDVKRPSDNEFAFASRPLNCDAEAVGKLNPIVIDVRMERGVPVDCV